MKARVIQPFFDLTTGLGNVPENTYRVGDVFEGDRARIDELAEKGFVEKPAPRRRTAKKQQ